MFTTTDLRSYYHDHGIWSARFFLVLLVLWSIYRIGLAIYRVTLSPIANFPGPKLAAITTWYAGYYDAWLGGQYFKVIDGLHAKYGPIVRINPDELHVSDINFIDEIFSGPSKRRDKHPSWGKASSLPQATAATVAHDLHRTRRAALNPFFSKASIRRLDPIIQRTLENLLKRFSACAKTGDIMTMKLVFNAATSDIISDYTFGACVDFLKRDDYNAPFFDSIAGTFEFAWWLMHMPWLASLRHSIPAPVLPYIMPGKKSLFQMQRQWTRQIKEISESKDLATNNSTVFHRILNSNVPPSEKSLRRLRQEAQQIVGASTDTTATALSAITFQLLINPDKLRKLKDELATALPDPNAAPTSAELERLPYLSAVIQEGLRLHNPGTARLLRVSPDAALVYRDRSTGKEWSIPAGTAVSMDIRTMNTNSTIFPEPHDFIPERWIDNPGLDKHLMTFSKGARMCVGINLAYAELYMFLAGIFRKYDLYDGTGEQKEPTLALYDTIRERDVDQVRDLLVSFPAKGSKGVRITVREGKTS